MGPVNFTVRAESVLKRSNPFALPAGILPKKGAADERRATAGVPEGGGAPDFRVTTILIGLQTKVAAINGKLVREGEEVEGFRVIEIRSGQVTLRRGQEKKIINLEPTRKVLFQPFTSDQGGMGPSK